MSSNRKLYDNCQIQNKIKESITPTDLYTLDIKAHENELNSEYCNKNSKVDIKNTFSDTSKRIDIENGLLLIDKKFTNCIHDKHASCDTSEKKKCNIGIIANPYICERDITPTNMVPIKNAGF
jgi:hypothetical protein